MAFKVCPVAYKKYAGVLCGLILQVGIIIGTILEVPYAYIIGINWIIHLHYFRLFYKKQLFNSYLNTNNLRMKGLFI